MANNRQLILSRLADGGLYSGTMLAEQLNISRAAVWKHIKLLQSEGVGIISDRRHGYHIPGGLQLLDAARIRSVISDDVAGHIRLNMLDKTASTNDWLMSRLHDGLASGSVCLAETQSAGRGTRGRQWQSPYGTNLYISLFWEFASSPVELGGLSLSIAAIISRALADAGAKNISIKWPNDLYTSAGKLGGILIDMSAEAGGPSHVVIGVGLNVDMPAEQRKQIDQAAADLRDSGLPVSVSRSDLAGFVIDAMVRGCKRFSNEGFAAFRKEWSRRDMVVGKQVRLTTSDQVILGEACGVDDKGAIELLTDSGRKAYASGDVTLRMA